jgi:hypothetical protein
LLITPKKQGIDAFLKDDLSLATTTGLHVSSNRVAYV